MSETIHLTVQSQPPVGLTTEQARVINAVSPTATVERVSGGAVLTVHDLNGTTTAEIHDGAKGDQGPVGPAGQDGQPGRDGVDGTPGAPGQDGADGVSPTVTVTDITGGHRVTITDVNGTKNVDVMDGADGQPGQAGADGQDGADGFSPTASVSKTGSTATITITDASGTTTAQVSDGTDGQDGQDGHSPVVTASKSGGVTTVSVDGEPIATINDGAQGKPGEDYVLTAQDKADIAGMVDVPSVATAAEAKAGQNASHYLAPSLQDASAFYGLCKAAGDTTQSSSSNAVGQYTDAAKVAIQKMLGLYKTPWEIIAERTVTNSTNADVIISTDSNDLTFELEEVRLLVMIPSNQESATSITDYALVTLYFDGTTTDKFIMSLSGSNPFTVAAGQSSNYISYLSAESANSMMKFEGAQWQKDTGRTNLQIPLYSNRLTSNYYGFRMGDKVITSIKIGHVEGTIKYCLYGRRKAV